jgi:acyl-CoA dehydrogenase
MVFSLKGFSAPWILDRYLLPYNAAWHAAVQAGDYPPPFLQDLKALAREEGLWNLFLPTLQRDEPGTRLNNLDYAPLAEAMGRLPWAAEVFNCHAPDTGNIELLHRFATPAQRTAWLAPLLEGRMRSAFAMSEPDVASSDPTNLQTTVRREGDDLVVTAASGSSPARRTRSAGCSSCCAAMPMPMTVPIPTATTATAWCWCPWMHAGRAGGAQHQRAAPPCARRALRDLAAQRARARRPAAGRLGAGLCHGAGAPGAGAGAPLHAHHWPVRAGPATGGRARAGAPRLWQAAVEQANVQEWLAESRIEIDQARCWCCTPPGCWTRATRWADARQVRAQVAAIKVVAARCSSAWWTAPCRFLAPWACRPTRRWPPSGPGAAPCA